MKARVWAERGGGGAVRRKIKRRVVREFSPLSHNEYSFELWVCDGVSFNFNVQIQFASSTKYYTPFRIHRGRRRRMKSSVTLLPLPLASGDMKPSTGTRLCDLVMRWHDALTVIDSKIQIVTWKSGIEEEPQPRRVQLVCIIFKCKSNNYVK